MRILPERVMIAIPGYRPALNKPRRTYAKLAKVLDVLDHSQDPPAATPGRPPIPSDRAALVSTHLFYGKFPFSESTRGPVRRQYVCLTPAAVRDIVLVSVIRALAAGRAGPPRVCRGTFL